MAPLYNNVADKVKISRDLGVFNQKIKQVPLFCESIALLKSYIKEQNKDNLFLDFEYRLVSDKISEVFVDFFEDVFEDFKELAGVAVLRQQWIDGRKY